MSTDQALLIGGLCAAFIAFIGAVTLILKGLRSLIEFRDEVQEFLLDWRGRPARDGRPAQRGVIHRITDIEQQLKPNGGQSMYDKVTQVRDQVVPSQRQGS